MVDIGRPGGEAAASATARPQRAGLAPAQRGSLREYCFPVMPGPGWHAPYVGVAYAWRGDAPPAWDCWGLYRYCLGRHFGRPDLPDFAGVRTEAAGSTREARFAAQEAAITENRAGWLRLSAPIPGAAVLFLIGGRPLHLGLYLGRGQFLHADRKTDTVVEDLDAPEWRHRLEGFHVPA